MSNISNEKELITEETSNSVQIILPKDVYKKSFEEKGRKIFLLY